MDTNLSPSRCPPRQAHCAAPGSVPGSGGGMPTLTHSEAVKRPAGWSQSSAGRPASSTKGRASVADTARLPKPCVPEPTLRPRRPLREQWARGLGAALSLALGRQARALSSHAGSPQVDPALVRWKPTQVHPRETAPQSRTPADSGRVTRHL